MKTQFIHDDFVLDVTHLELSWQEENTWFKDEFFMISSFPFEISYEENAYLERFRHVNLTTSDSLFKGKLEKDGRLEFATLEIEEAAEKLRITIRYGIEALPNWTKMLSELNLEIILENGGDMIQHANSIINQTWPAVNYNFPAIHSEFYKDTAMFEDFEGVINLRKTGQFITNIIDGSSTKNRNIVYPMPYHLYVLKMAVEDSGHTLHGDILSDPDLIDAVIVPGKKIVEFEGIPKPIEWNIGIGDKTYDSGFPVYVGFWHSDLEVNFRGSFHLTGTINNETKNFKIKLNGNLIFTYTSGMPLNFNVWFQTSLETNSLTIDVVSEGITNSESNAVMMVLKTLFLKDEDGEMLPFFANFSNVHLADKLPQMTVGDFIKFHKRLKNYDFDLRNGNQIWMNLIQNEVVNSEVVDISEWDIKRPTRRFDPDKSFVLQYEDEFEEFPFTKVFADKNEFKIDVFEKHENTEEISINGIPLPIQSKDGIKTAVQLSDDESKLMITKYNGLTNNQNFAQEMPGLDCYQLYFNFWQKWLNFMIHAVRFVWTIKSDPNSLMKIKRKSKLHAFNTLLFVFKIQRSRRRNVEEIEIEALSTKV